MGGFFVANDSQLEYDFLYFHYDEQIWYGVKKDAVTRIGLFANINSEYIFRNENKVDILRNNSISISEDEYEQLADNSEIIMNGSVLAIGRDAFEVSSSPNEAVAYVFFDPSQIPEGNLWVDVENIAEYGITKTSDGNRYGIISQNEGLLDMTNLANPEYSPTVAEKDTALVVWRHLYEVQKRYFTNAINGLSHNSSSNWCHVRGANFVRFNNQIKEDIMSKNQDHLFREVYKTASPTGLYYLISRAISSGFGYTGSRIVDFDGHSFHKSFPRAIIDRSKTIFKPETVGLEIQTVYLAEISEELKQSVDMAIEFMNSIVRDCICITMSIRDLRELKEELEDYEQIFNDRTSFCFVPKSRIQYSSTKRKIYWQQRDLERAQYHGLSTLPGGAKVGDLRFEKPLVKSFQLYLNLEKLNDPNLGYYNYHDNFGPTSFPNHVNKFASMIVAQIIKALGVGTLWNNAELLGFINPGEDDEKNFYHNTVNRGAQQELSQVLVNFTYTDSGSTLPVGGKQRNLSLYGNVFGHYMVRTFEGQQYIGPESEYLIFDSNARNAEKRSNSSVAFDFYFSNMAHVKDLYVSYIRSDSEPQAYVEEVVNLQKFDVENAFTGGYLQLKDTGEKAYHYASVFGDETEELLYKKFTHNQFVFSELHTRSNINQKIWKIFWYIDVNNQTKVIDLGLGTGEFFREVQLGSAGTVVYPPTYLFNSIDNTNPEVPGLIYNPRIGEFVFQNNYDVSQGWVRIPTDSTNSIMVYTNEVSFAEKSITTESHAASEAIHQYKNLCSLAGFGGSQYYTDSIPLDADPTEKYFISDKISSLYNNPLNKYVSANVSFLGDKTAIGLWTLGGLLKTKSVSLFLNQLEFVNNDLYRDRYWAEGDDSNGRTRARISSHHCVSHKACLPPGFLIGIDCNHSETITLGQLNPAGSFVFTDYEWQTIDSEVKFLSLQYDTETQKNKLIQTSTGDITSDSSGENIHNLQVDAIKNEIAANAKQPSLHRLISQYYIDYNSNKEILIDPITLGFLYDLGYDVSIALNDTHYPAFRHSHSRCKDNVITLDTFDDTNYEII